MNHDLLCFLIAMITSCGVLFPVMILGPIEGGKATKKTTRICVTIMVTGILSFLWLPWLGYGVHSAWKFNMALINDKPVPETVLPPTPIQRPSVQDTVE